MFDKLFTELFDLETKNKSLMARIYISIATVSIVNVQAMIKVSSAPLYQILYHRGLLIFASNIFFFSKKPSVVDSSKDYYVQPVSKMYICLLSTFILTLQLPLFFISQKMIPIGESHVLLQSNTIWGQFLAVYFLKEAVSWSRIRNLALSFVGLFLIVRPAFLFGVSEESTDNQHFLGSIYTLICGFIQACSYSLVKIVGDKVPPNIQATYFHIQVLLVAAIMLAIEEINMSQITFQYLQQLVAMAFFAYLSHILTYRAYSLYSFAKLAPLQFLGVVYGILIDVIIFQSFPEVLSIIGCVLVLGSVIAQSQEKID